ncbi:endonuclease domain-containing protein [Streptomyces sp. SP2-10]|uniref:endonuclease domain-containing protein n=1 Tax=Streptomyces sp. SP2-10 TaxID=2873385 RepID=UPI001CA7225F|nr:endonuclease domain-containing protein [Streptomyces sp. SP2-10]MBY8844584.1 endonuclease VII domain-containing protein [Streptomyces sp. SP2-10]
MISPEYAGRLLEELTQGCPVPAVPTALSRYAFQVKDHVLIGDVTVRGYKYKNRWRLDEREIRKAGERLASLPVDADDLVDARLTSAGDDRSWRSQIMRWFSETAYADQSINGCHCDGQKPCSRTGPNQHGLGCGATREQLEAAYGQAAIAGTRPLPLLTWSGTAWMIPRAYGALLDRADLITAQSAEQAARCRKCGAAGDIWQWRTSSATGYTTLCPSCTSAVARPYKNHLRGRLYASLPKSSEADAFLCQLCPEPRRAMYWDHCHEHGLVRGPVCASCNTFEGGGGRFINRPGAVRHLLQCDGCRRERTVPPRHQPDVVVRTFVFDPHDGCPRRPHRPWGTVEADGSIRFRLWCWHHTPVHRWEQTVPSTQVSALVAKFVDEALTEHGEDDCGQQGG